MEKKISPAVEQMYEAERQRLAHWRGLGKREWIAAARSELNPGEAEPCQICGMDSEISQFHHVIPLSEQYDRGFVTPSRYPSAWLCPNHHAMLHKFLGLADFRKYGEPRRYRLTPEQAEKLYELVLKSRKESHKDGNRRGTTP